jgi:CubicO group peptidase (beta-lactamase class C family)
MTSSTFLLPEEEVALLPAQYKGTEGGVVEIDRHIYRYKPGSEYESGGAGCITNARDYIKFLEAMRCEKILSREVLDLMYRDHLTDGQRVGYWAPRGYGYGLGVRVPDSTGKRTDIGWGGAAGAFLALDESHGISLYYAQHVLNTPNKNLRKDIIEAAKLDLGYEAFTEDMNLGEGSHLA